MTHEAAEAVRRGHPWIWAGSIVRGAAARAGEVVEIVSNDRSSLGRGIADPGSPLAVRVWTTGPQAIDEALFGERAAHAFALRAQLFASGATSAYRLLNGEGDRMPGFVLDRYAGVAVLRVDGDAAAAWLERVARALEPHLAAHGVATLVHRVSVKGENPRLTVLAGASPPDTLEVTEHDVPFVVDLTRGQKTGAFLDQRENRRRVRELARGRRVLNLFSYAGGFSVQAALGGASHVTSVDVAPRAHATAQESFRRAGVNPRAHAFVTADVFAFLAQAKRRGEAWDLVVSDPPSFAPNERSLPRALAAYRSLHRACTDVLAPGGIFCAASCSSHVDADAFVSTLDDEALASKALRLIGLHGLPPDHPTPAAWREGRYLKFAVLA